MRSASTLQIEVSYCANLLQTKDSWLCSQMKLPASSMRLPKICLVQISLGRFCAIARHDYGVIEYTAAPSYRTKKKIKKQCINPIVLAWLTYLWCVCSTGWQTAVLHLDSLPLASLAPPPLPHRPAPLQLGHFPLHNPPMNGMQLDHSSALDAWWQPPPPVHVNIVNGRRRGGVAPARQ